MYKKVCIVVVFCLSILCAGYLFGKDASGTLPAVRVLGGISAVYEPVSFDHAKHASIAGKCDACHHHAEGKSDLCSDCHKLGADVYKKSVTRSFAACSNCHGANNPESPAVPGLKVAYHQKCFGCHKGMGNVGLNPKGCTELCHAKNKDKNAPLARQ